VEFRRLDRSHLDAALDLRLRAFGPMDAQGARRWREVNEQVIDEGRLYGVLDGATVVAAGKARGFEQLWLGRGVRMAGMAGITVAPECRGRGVGTLLMRGLAERSVERGEPVSALYPATVPVYRKLGWEFAGAQHRYSLRADHLRLLGGTSRVRPLRSDDAAEVSALVRRLLVDDRVSGPIVWSPETWRHALSDPARFAYACDDGVVLYGWDGGELSVELMAAGTEDALRSLWSVVGSGSSVVTTVTAFLAPDDPVLWLLPEEAGQEVTQHGWMFRVLDVPAALTARGYPVGVSAELVLVVDDPESPSNTGAFRVTVEGGAATVEPVDDPGAGLAVTARGLAGLYAGRPAAGLRRAGLAAGDGAACELADLVFATSTAYLTEYF